MKPKGKKSLNIDAELHQAIAVASAQTGKGMYELMREAWDVYLAGSAPIVSGEYPYAESNRVWHDRLERILVEGSERDRIGIEQNIEWAVRSIGPARPQERKAG